MSIYPAEAKAILFLLTSDESLADPVITHFEKSLGPAEIKGGWVSFDNRYYEAELGSNLKRCMVSFKNIFEPHKLVDLKNFSRELECRGSFDLLRKTGHGEPVEPYRRIINIDPGYVDLFKMVLASGKSGGQKVALSRDVFVYTLLRYEKGKWHPFEWTYPDFKAPFYHEDLLKVRSQLKRDLTDRL